MPNMPHWPTSIAPVDKQSGDLRLCMRVVSHTPARMVYRSLQIDQQEYGTGSRK